jgi:mitochondrial import receptor subunit TOM40
VSCVRLEGCPTDPVCVTVGQVLDGAGVVAGSYLQSLTRRLAIGTELTLQRDRQGRVGSGLTFAARYSGADYTLTGNITSNGGLLATYCQRARDVPL